MTAIAARAPVVLLGATASGKSAVALAAAQEAGLATPVEIVVVDSMQVYRGMDIGTAKPTTAERAAVRHHGIDLVEPTEDFTVADYRRVYDAAVDDLSARGHRALLVAGTGLYLRAVVDGLTPPGRWPDVRAELESEPSTELLHARLDELDPDAASRMEPTNRRRVLRALEVCIGSGRPFSSFGPGLTTYPAIDTIQIGLRWPRDVLARRVEARFHQMMAAGLLDEVRRLVAAHGCLSRTAGQALGYKELLAHLQGELSLDEAVDLAVSRTRRYAVRQLRWFQRDPRVRWVEMGSDDAMAVLVAALSR
jgi:tRNA dimethylallyltransferase